uniref:F-box domain-containing protein n=1 Tax=Ditylenchus dipsaci TaxID=166011 RepID=A0A915D0V6_9BILA
MLLLNDLPLETLLCIFDHVPAPDLWRNVRAINKQMHNIIQPNSFWLNRAQNQFKFQLPSRMKPKPAETSSGVKHCVAVNTAVEKWSCRNKPGGQLASPKSCIAHYGTIDAVKIFHTSNKKRFCVTGARDRKIILWDLEKVAEEEDKKQWISAQIADAHSGWIWSLNPVNDKKIYSSSWDGTIKEWLITESNFELGRQASFGCAVLSSINEGDHQIYLSTFKRGPILCDTRAGISPVKTLNCHGNRAVINMATEEQSNYIFSVGEDNKLISVDKRMFKPVKSMCSERGISHVDAACGYLGVSLKDGLLRFLDPNTLKVENELQLPIKDQLRHNGHVYTRVSRGATICAYDYDLTVYTAGIEPRLLRRTSVEAAVTQMDLLDNDLVAGMGECSVSFWL